MRLFMLGLSERAAGLRIRICTDPPTKIFYLAVISASRSFNRGLGSRIWTWGPAWFALRKFSGSGCVLGPVLNRSV
jgi:hypothetical protein